VRGFPPRPLWKETLNEIKTHAFKHGRGLCLRPRWHRRARSTTGDAPGAKSDITIVRDNTANAPGGTGVEESTESKDATSKQGLNEATPLASGAGSVQGGGDNSSDQGGTGATGLNEGPSTGNARGGSGAEKSAEGQGAQNKSAY
jgi:hypothetical protein